MHAGSSYTATLIAQAAGEVTKDICSCTLRSYLINIIEKQNGKKKKINPVEHNHLRSTECHPVFSTKNGEKKKILK